MKRISTLFIMVTLLLVCSAASLSAQHAEVRGRLVDSNSGNPLPGATVAVEGTTIGTPTELDGTFVLKNVPVNSKVICTFVGYDLQTFDITLGGSINLGVIQMKESDNILGDVTITSSIAVQRKTPVAVSTIGHELIRERLGTLEFPEILKSTPGVYATKGGGGFGDSRINIRGFESANIAVMVNGVPVNEMEWGGIYWSNWTGLTDVTRSMQVQRGLGASKIAMPSVGGSINIITNTTDAKEGASLFYGIGNDGYQKLSVSASTGLTEKGWAFSLMGSRTKGDGYIDGTSFESYVWFVNVSKRFGTKHSLSLTAFGAPQKHNRRNINDKLSIVEWKKQGRGKRYNPTYGTLNGKEIPGVQYNHYHKPQISLNHNWDINLKSSLSTAFYVSIGEGGGWRGQGDAYADFYGSTNGVPNTAYRRADGTFDYDALMASNVTTEKGGRFAIADNKNTHTWYGLLSTYSHNFDSGLDLQAGIDLRYYMGGHKAVLRDMFGSDFFIDPDRTKNNHWQAGNPDYVYEKLHVGDIVYRNFDSRIGQYGAFAQLEYELNDFNFFVAGNFGTTTNMREEKFYLDNEKSPTIYNWNWGIKGGLNYNITERHNVFGNIGYFSRAPFSSGGIFLSNQNSNQTNPNSKNEKVFSAELGYGYVSKTFTANLNVYHTEWRDKTMVKAAVSGDVTSNVINMEGVNALHMGVEIEMKYKPIQAIELTGMFSFGDWQWNSNATGFWYTRDGDAIDKGGNIVTPGSEEHARSTLNLKDIKVGNSAQVTAALGVTVEPIKGLRIGFDGNYYGRNYSNFDISLANLNGSGVQEFEQPWKMPTAWVFDGRLSYSFKLAGFRTTIYANVMNVFNTMYITDAQDNGAKSGGHGWQDATVFYGFGRTWSAGLRFTF